MEGIARRRSNRGGNVREGIVHEGKCPGGNCPGVKCPRTVPHTLLANWVSLVNVRKESEDKVVLVCISLIGKKQHVAN